MAIGNGLIVNRKETCSDFSVCLGGTCLPNFHVNGGDLSVELLELSENRAIGRSGLVGVASKAVCLLGGQDSGFVRSLVVAPLMWSRSAPLLLISGISLGYTSVATCTSKVDKNVTEPPS